MNNLHLYVVETYHPEKEEAIISIKEEISSQELSMLNSAFRICGLYHRMTQIKNIVVENGESFKRYMCSENLKEIRRNNISPDRAIMLANKSVLNYATSIKTYIDMETRILKKNASQDDSVKSFEAICRFFYDNNMEYRFWVNFRNYIVHCEFPYSIYHESVDKGCEIICIKENLLQFDNWKHSKTDIQQMSNPIDLPELVDKMSSMIYALYIDFFRYFAEEILDGISTYGSFCRKYNVKAPAILKAKDHEKIEGSHLQPLPVKELRASFDILRSNPKIDINIK